tara:strand:+ start:171 stop:488 length:318 start_codon:yes stop_codon:yes gene_type:complete
MKRKKVSFSIGEKYYSGMVANLVTQILQSFGTQYGTDVTKTNAAFAENNGPKIVKAIEDLILNAESSLKELESLSEMALDIEDLSAKVVDSPEEDAAKKKKSILK